MNLHFKQLLEKTLSSVVKLKVVYSNDVQSKRIEGQFGGEMLKKAFSEINIYIQYTPTLLNYKILRDIINQCYYSSMRIKSGERLGIRCYMFNDIDYGIMPIDKTVFFKPNHEQDPLIKAIEEFHASGDIRTLNRLTRANNISENTLCLFITDNLGCELSDNVKMKYKRINKQSIWVIVDGEKIDVKKGIPTLNYKSMEENHG